ncbi:ELMO domain-containing protein [Psidium guajava]|nr:ELMO domain-containing protein [Psidium guajava]
MLCPKAKLPSRSSPQLPLGITDTLALTKGSSYNSEFAMGDAKDSCLGDLVLYVQAGSSIWNFTVRSGGLARPPVNYSISFRAESSLTPISFTSFNET